MAEKQVLARDGAVGLELAEPVPVGGLGREEGRLGPVDCGVDLGLDDGGRSHTWLRELCVAHIA